MRKGSRCRPWTTEEERYLLEYAGEVPKREICKKLRRSDRSVARKAEELRRKGKAVCLRHYDSRLTFCPSCGCMRLTVDRSGTCEPCRRREQLHGILSRIADLWPYLPIEERAIYEETEAETESGSDPMPRSPDLTGYSHYSATRLKELYEIELERWAIRNLNRQVKAAQKRKERIEKKVKSMGLY